ncbi:MAG: ATP-binding protein [Ignavibacteriaceae bacterium]
MLAVRELIINAVIHRDYSLKGKDIKIAIFDDMLEITSPGTIPPSIDLNNLSSGQSEIRNKILAPIFKGLRLIEQWGTGFQKLSDELKEHPEIEIKFNEPGLSFQVQFIKKASAAVAREQGDIAQSDGRDYVGTKLGLSKENLKQLLFLCKEAKSLNELMLKFEFSNKSKFKEREVNPLLELGLIELTNPGKPKSPKQKYRTTAEGKDFLKTLSSKNGKL